MLRARSGKVERDRAGGRGIGGEQVASGGSVVRQQRGAEEERDETGEGLHWIVTGPGTPEQAPGPGQPRQEKVAVDANGRAGGSEARHGPVT